MIILKNDWFNGLTEKTYKSDYKFISTWDNFDKLWGVLTVRGVRQNEIEFRICQPRKVLHSSVIIEKPNTVDVKLTCILYGDNEITKGYYKIIFIDNSK